jgi:hypothetical protein
LQNKSNKKVSRGEGEHFQMLSEYMQSLSPNWRAIYYEAVRGNHILFEQSDLNAFANLDISAPKASEEQRSIRVIKTAARLIASPSLQSMRDEIAPLTLEEKFFLFRIYNRYLSDLKTRVKSSLN